jgi:hypothetical protein
MKYTNYTNLDSRYMRGYQPGDRLVQGWSDDTLLDGFADRGLETVAEFVFHHHNMDGRPDGQMCPSMSIGDVVVFTIDDIETALTVEAMGFAQVELSPADLITDRSWKMMMEAER